MNTLSCVSDLDSAVLDYLGHQVTVTAEQNLRGAWVPKITITVDGRHVSFDIPQDTTPEWLTQHEALRAGIERARYLIESQRRAS